MFITATATAIEQAFDRIDAAGLDCASEAVLDTLPFGVVGFSPEGLTEVYNATEARYAGLRRENALGQPFFLSIGACMNNYLVAQRFEDEPEIDAILDYVLTFRMRPTPVKLRLLKNPAVRRRYLLVRR